MLCRAGALTALALALAAPAPAAEIASTIDPAALPEAKRTPLGLYLTAEEAHRALADDPGIVFIDVRDPHEVMFVGHPKPADANVPLRIATHAFDAKAGRYVMTPNPAFLAEVAAVMTREGRGPGDPVFVMCRSGARSAAAASLLAEAGYDRVWSVVDGFEGAGGTGPDAGGWRDAGLPWTRELDAETAWTPAD